MKILHVVASLQAVSGGPAVSVSRLATEQARLGHDVVVAAFDERHLGPALPTDGVKRVLVPVNFLSMRGRGWSPGFRRTLMDEARNADIVHNHGLWMWPNAYAREAAVAAGKPLVISPRGMLESWSLNRSKLRKAVAWHLFERKNLRSAALFHATAESEAESIRDATKKLRKVHRWEGGKMEKWESGNRIVVAPNGVDLPDLANRPDRKVLEGKFPQLEGRRWVVFMSRLHPKKGVDVLLRAWKRQNVEQEAWKRRQGVGGRTSERKEAFRPLISSSLGPVLVVAGPDLIGYRRKLEEMVRELGLDDSVVMTGEVRGEAKSCLLGHAEVFVLPSFSENFGIAVAEAMAWGRPIITTTGTPWQEVAQVGAGWWVNPAEDDLVCALSEALQLDGGQLQAKGAAGRRLVQNNYCWAKCAHTMIAAYAESLMTKIGGPQCIS